ncbi:3-isopropylmalate dehydrogenase [Candidatus Woesearchaeota archaeon]|nr:3-isopropylmalate dehydrogenase [Candidatus Woesearchaeota archaeon]
MYKIALIPGDLIGPVVTDAALCALDAAKPAFKDPSFEVKEFPLGADFYLQHGEALPRGILSELEGYNAILKGPVGDPSKVKPGVLETGIIIGLRQYFDQYVNLRPVRLPEGVPSILAGKGPAEINFVIVRENTEGLYARHGGASYVGTDSGFAQDIMVATQHGVDRVLRYSAEYALRHPKPGEKPKLTVVHKTNILVNTAQIWNEGIKRVKAVYPDLAVEYSHVDAFAMRMLTNPETIHVAAMENMFGDILTDIGAVLQGGIGSAASGNINPYGVSMFEPIHGSAPDIVGTEKVRIEAMVMAAAMMLEHLGEETAADIIRQAALENIRKPDYSSRGTTQLTSDLLSRVEELAGLSGRLEQVRRHAMKTS